MVWNVRVHLYIKWKFPWFSCIDINSCLFLATLSRCVFEVWCMVWSVVRDSNHSYKILFTFFLELEHIGLCVLIRKHFDAFFSAICLRLLFSSFFFSPKILFTNQTLHTNTSTIGFFSGCYCLLLCFFFKCLLKWKLLNLHGPLEKTYTHGRKNLIFRRNLLFVEFEN